MPDVMTIGENVIIVDDAMGIFKWCWTSKCDDSVSKFEVTKSKCYESVDW